MKNIIVIFDEITSGFRKCKGGMHLLGDVYPDAVLYGKTISSGYPFSALLGTDAFFSGLNSTFISSVYWTDRIGPAAALATLKEVEKIGTKLFDHLSSIGSSFKKRLESQLREHSLI